MVNETHSKDGEPTTEEGKEGNDKGADSPDGEYNPHGELRRWMEAINAVSEITRLNWSQVFDITALEFFAYLSFYNYTKRKEQQEIEAFGRKNKIKK